MKKLALLGAAHSRYEEKIKNESDKCGHCWFGWTYKIHPSKKEILNKQDSFHIYIYNIKHGKGTGLVEHIQLVKKNNYRYADTPFKSPEPECTPPSDRLHRLYVNIDKLTLIPSREWNTFRDFDTEIQLAQLKVYFPPRNPNVEFLYIIDEDGDC